ncbi:unnamed protein product, partial [Citrullus colocynthis]
MAMFSVKARLFLAFFFVIGIHNIFSYTDPNDVEILLSLKEVWKNTPPTWRTSSDPCGDLWEGVSCNDSRVTELKLPYIGLEGHLSGDIGGLTELITLDLSFNRYLTGPLSPRLGDLRNLKTLILAACGFSGNIPQELGNLTQLMSLALNSNQLIGSIPRSLGKLSKLVLLDLMENQLNGSLPVSTFDSPGLDLLLQAKHFHLSKNRLSGSIPPKLFSADMKLTHNQFSGSIPQTLGLVNTLELLRLDRNSLTGIVPSDLTNLKQILQLNLAHNNLTGPLPNLTQMTSLRVVDLSYTSFDASTAPDWFSSLPSLTRSLNMGNWKDLSQKQSLAYHRYNKSDLKPNFGSPVLNCETRLCSNGEKNNPQSCECQYPFVGSFYFRGSSIRDLSNDTLFQLLKYSLSNKLNLSIASVVIQKPVFESDDYLHIQLQLFPPFGKYFNRSEILRIASALSYQTFLLSPDLGSFYFIPLDQYNLLGKSPPDVGNFSSISNRWLIGIAIGCGLLLLTLLGVGVYAIKQKKRVSKAISLSKPFASWSSIEQISGEAPQLKEAIYFSYDELRKLTNNFSISNEIGAGGYGKVYRGITGYGQVFAIKRARQGSKQDAHEFKTEIELLSRVHHKNLVGLVGFCCEQGEQMLVYEFMPYGLLRDNL